MDSPVAFVGRKSSCIRKFSFLVVTSGLVTPENWSNYMGFGKWGKLITDRVDPLFDLKCRNELAAFDMDQSDSAKN
jgi:hypothetical protein